MALWVAIALSGVAKGIVSIMGSGSRPFGSRDFKRRGAIVAGQNETTHNLRAAMYSRLTSFDSLSP